MTSSEHLIKLKTVESVVGKLDREMTTEQLNFILHPVNEGCNLEACPGSGKTEVVGIKTVYEIMNWKDRFSGIATLSFTKNAAKEISDRVARYGSTKALLHPHFVGTIDSWLHGFLLHPFAHHSVKYKGNQTDCSIRLVDNESHYDFLNSFKTKLSDQPYAEAHVNDYYFECTDPTMVQSQKRTLNLDKITELILSDLKTKKKKFLNAGLATYADAEFLCYILLKNNPIILKNIVGRFPVLFIDECQDLSNNQLEIFKLLRSQGANIHLIGDPNQSIYEFKKVYVEKIQNFIDELGLKRLYLTRNFRSNQDIVDLCLKLEVIHSKISKNVILGNDVKLIKDTCVLWEYDDDDVHILPQKFINHISELNKLPELSSTPIDIAKSAILARGHTTLSQFRNQKINELTKVQLFANALACWNQQPRNSQDLQNSLQQVGKSISMFFFNGSGNHTRQYAPIDFPAVEWRNRLTKILEFGSRPLAGLYPFDEMTWSSWAKVLKKFLAQIYFDFAELNKTWDQIKSSVIAPSKLAKVSVATSLRLTESKYSCNVRVTTFHEVKGESLDATLIISSKDKKSKGGHYEHWINEDTENKEFVRLAYVACSRPRHLLILAIPKSKQNKHLTLLKEIGFVLTRS